MLNYPTMKKGTSSLLRALTSIILIVILLYVVRGKYGDILKTLKSTNTILMALAFALFTIASLVASFRMKIIIGAQGIKIRYREALSLTFIGYFFNNFLPTAIGGDVVICRF